jgi:hypothetical protein
VDLEGRGCPCIDGYECVNERCVPSDGTSSDCLIGVGSFKASWSTPHSIRWEWEPVGKELDFQEYRIVTGKTPDDAQNATGSARIWTSADNPELGVFTLRRTAVEDLVRHTITDELDPDTLYHAELRVVDSAGCVARSPNVAGKATTDATPKMSVMSDPPVGGWGDLAPTSTGCFQGSGCWSATAVCPPGEASCFTNYERGQIDLDLGSMTAGTFATSYIELAFRRDSSTQGWWGVFSLLLGGDGSVAWTIEPMIFRAGDYYKIELPLAAFVRIGTRATPTPEALTVAATGGTLSGISIGVELDNGTHAFVDEVSVGW